MSSTLTVSGYAIDQGPEAFGKLRDSTAYASEPTELRRRLLENGYLFLRGVVEHHRTSRWPYAELGPDRLEVDGHCGGLHLVPGLGEPIGAGRRIPGGQYLALLSHSGSRGAGATIAGHYSKLAMSQHPELPRELTQLSWLDLDSAEGQEYWNSMELMGHYASANHACIHHHIPRYLGANVLLDLENHHNFAWKEEHDGETLIVHRKGATPAGEGVLGIIPGSMASPTYVARGKGNPASLNSAAHGAGRVMSRTQAKNTFAWSHVRGHLEERGVTLLSAGIDEVPMVYKDIDKVMAQQADLVDTVASFQPKIVKMSPPGERAED